MSEKKVAVFGCKQTTRFLIESLHAIFPLTAVITIDKELGHKNKVADYYDVGAYAKSLDIPVYHTNKYSLKDEDDINYINSLQLDLVFVIGWQRLIPNDILSHLSIGAFGMHGSSMNLPLGRGRSPMNWSIIEGRKVFYTNLFKYDPGIDSGDVLDTFKFTINEKDTGETMHFKNTLAMKYLILKNIKNLLEHNIVLKKQKDLIPSYYPKRTPADSLIDWTRDVNHIERFIRAVTRPFNGAFSFINDHRLVIYSAQIFDVHEYGYDNAPVGTIVEILTPKKFLIKCFGGLLLVNEYESDYRPKKEDCFSNGQEAIKYFQLNKYGGFDIYEEEPSQVISH